MASIEYWLFLRPVSLPLTITVYSPRNSPRLQYVLRWLFAMQPGIDYLMIYDEDDAAELPFCISYGKVLPNALSIPDAELLWQTGIQQHTIPTGTWNGIPTLYATEGNYTIPFDLFSATFFMLSRYEEYYEYTPDKHGRYPATDSIVYRNGWLQRPLVDEWLQQLRITLRQHFDIPIQDGMYMYQPTYDIDIAYTYRHKSRQRTMGAYAKDILRGNFQAAKQRTSVLLNKNKQDPYDSFEWMRQLHRAYGYRPIYFVLAALHTTDYDKNILPTHPQMRVLVDALIQEGNVGMHPSYYTDTQHDVWRNEKNTLESLLHTNKKITQSRQHYIKLRLPDTYRFLLSRSILEDYSMGYGTYLGFRAGTGQPFQWYDIEKEQTTLLQVYPFCFMDTTALYEEKMNAPTAFAILRTMQQRLQQTGSTLITVFHNFSLGTAPEWLGWREAYETFMSGK